MRFGSSRGRFGGVAALAAVALLALTAAGCGGGGSSSGSGGDKVTLRLDWVAQGYQAPFYAAEALGYYDEEGVDVEIEDGRGTTTAIKLVANGSDTFGFGQVSEVAYNAHTLGVPVVVIASMMRKMPDAVFAREGSGIETLKDLEGKSVVSSPDDSSRAFFPALAAANGIDVDKVRFLNVSSDAKLSTFINGRGDALINFSTVKSELDSAGVKTKMFLYADNGVNLLSQGLFTNSETAANDPDLVARFVRASMRGLDYVQQNPEEAVKFVVDARPDADPDDMLAQLQVALELVNTQASAGHPTGYMAPEDWEQSFELMEQFREMDPVEPDEKLYTNEFVESAGEDAETT